MSKPWVRWVGVLLIVVILVIAPLIFPVFVNQTLARIGVFAVAVLGLNVVMGYTGQVSLGQIFFVGVGAYVTAYGVNNDWNIALVFVLAALIPGIFGLVIALAAARLGGLAIAMVTIALPIVGVPLAKRLSEVTGGSQGTSARFSGAPEGTGLADDQWQLYIVIAVAAVVFLLTRNLVRGKYGRAFAIVKGNEAVASSMGISPYRYKVLAFTIASLIGGVSGFLYMVVVQYTSPETMSFGHSITLLAAMVIGGAGSIVGSLLGGAYYVLAPQVTNAIDSSLTAVLQGVILLVILFVLPRGLVSLPRLWRRKKSNGHNGNPAGAAPEQQNTAAATVAPSVTSDPSTPPTPTQSQEKRQDT
ncbi:branched-chain amino acid ABC transporter permease [Microbacterium sp. zg.B48]|uniref:branched-chain amino acid ABC transporter permease n=1 Tax=unclassified Microbacterium TaxID=2609290 RepID=UPI00214B28EC|nr:MULTISPECIES: branched-chain amino acid ABC transporter permease [unclassified Microbacterium]MCR2762927.1 branched-chain amino acid ABC transporter permease [Microbacterium sp. zg.B48]MCR2808514.1 branched-chain amino acid ABC transporter permease [Microbacterium sp. zg.B185]WIM19046.1 branched-chain amino acid ABC transporter permease [Microbacterium sp. zg-B185]